MAQIASVFRRFVPQLLHMIVLPIFFFAFILLYRPFGIVDYLGSEWFGVHLTIISCIVMLCIAVARSAYYFIPMNINYTIYIFWCLGEMIFTSFFVAISIGEPYKPTLPVISNHASSNPNGSTWSV